MKDSSTRQLLDDQLLSIITAWSVVHDYMVTSSMLIPDKAFEWEDKYNYVYPELATARRYSDLQEALMLVARKIISTSQDAGVITLEEWYVIYSILCRAGTDEPIEESWR